MNKIRQGDYPMATMSSARFRSLYRRRKQAYEAVYHFSANSVRQVVTGFSATRTTETSPVPSADERSAPPSAARWQRPDWPDSPFRTTSQLQIHRRQPHAEDFADRISGQRPGNEVHRWWHSHHRLHHRQHRTLEEQCRRTAGTHRVVQYQGLWQTCRDRGRTPPQRQPDLLRRPATDRVLG